MFMQRCERICLLPGGAATAAQMRSQQDALSFTPESGCLRTAAFALRVQHRVPLRRRLTQLEQTDEQILNPGEDRIFNLKTMMA
jgi:hypothetical protein